MSFGKEILSAFAKHGDRIALVTEREETTYAEALTQVGHVAANFRACGVGAGTRVGLAMQNTRDVLLGILACWQLSATAVVIDFRAPRNQRALLVSGFNLSVIFEDIAMPGNEPYPNIVFGPDWRRVSRQRDDLPTVGDDTNPAILLFSSGTTGLPKAYIQTHEGLSRRMASRRSFLDSSEPRFLTPMPLTYSATRHYLFGYLLQGATIRLFPPFFSPHEIMEEILAFRASASALPPAVIARLVKEAGIRSEPLFPRLAALQSIGGPARADDKVGAYTYLTPGYRIAYSSSLTGTVTLLAGPDVLAKPATTGRVIPSARVDILGDEAEALPIGRTGAIRAWTTTIAPAVIPPGGTPYVDPETMGPGWGIPGDIGYLDEDGFLTIVDRQADMIVRGGVSVAPQELERIVARHPKVLEVAVVGFPDDIMGQEIAAFIVSDGATVDDFLTYMRANIAPDRRPREIRLVRSLPYNEHGKLQRRKLIEEVLRERPEDSQVSRGSS